MAEIHFSLTPYVVLLDLTLLALFCFCIWVFLAVSFSIPCGVDRWSPGWAFPGVIGMSLRATLVLGTRGIQAKPGLLGILYLPASSLYFSFHGPWAKKYCDQASLAIWQSGWERATDSVFMSDQKSTLSWAQAAMQMHTSLRSVFQEMCEHLHLS